MSGPENKKTWLLKRLPLGKKVVGWVWVFIVKCKASGTIEKYRAWLVAKGFTESDDHETFAHVVKLNSIRVL